MTGRLNARQFPKVYEDLGIDMNNLGCIMVDLDPLVVIPKVHEGEKDLYHHPDPEKYKYLRGSPAEEVAHVTLLYGMLGLGSEWNEHVDYVLDGWELPSVKIEEVSYFPSSIPGEDYSVIIGKVALTDQLLEGHHRLQMLPHIDTFPGYHPHITLAYVKNGPSDVDWAVDIKDKWVQTLNLHFQGREFPVKGLNYGD